MKRLDYFHRAQAERFARDLDVASVGGPRRGAVNSAYESASGTSQLVELAASLRATSAHTQAPAAMKTALRQRLLTEPIPQQLTAAQRQEAGAAQPAKLCWADFAMPEPSQVLTAQPTRRRWSAGTGPASAMLTQWQHKRRWIAAAALGLMLSGTAGTAMASEAALPGQALYPVKRKLENVRVALAWDDTTRGRLYVSQAHERLEEAETLARQPDAATNPDLQATVQDLINAAQNSSSSAQTATPELEQFIKDSTPRINELKHNATIPSSLATSLDALTKGVTHPTPSTAGTTPSGNGSTDPGTSPGAGTGTGTGTVPAQTGPTQNPDPTSPPVTSEPSTSTPPETAPPTEPSPGTPTDPSTGNTQPVPGEPAPQPSVPSQDLPGEGTNTNTQSSEQGQGSGKGGTGTDTSPKSGIQGAL